MTDKLIVFTSRKIPNNSFTMRGEQMCTALRKIGYNAVCMHRNEARKVKDAVIIWVRRCLVDWKMKQYQDNINILDPLDRVDHDFLHTKNYNIQAVIFSSKATRRIYGTCDCAKGLPQYVLYHHWDPRLKSRIFNHFEIGYWGYKYSACHANVLVDKHNWLDNARSNFWPSEEWFNRCSCHYNVRDKKRGAGFRPTTKVSTAAACGANIVLNREPINLELLPADYPYFVDVTNNRDQDYLLIKDMVTHARATYNTPIWDYGLRCMAKVRRLTSIDKCAKLYGSVIEQICERYK